MKPERPEHATRDGLELILVAVIVFALYYKFALLPDRDDGERRMRECAGYNVPQAVCTEWIRP